MWINTATHASAKQTQIRRCNENESRSQLYFFPGNLCEDVWRWFCFANYAVCKYNSMPEQTMEFSFRYVFPDTSGVVFDTRSKMVMSQGGTAERMKEKVRRFHAVHCYIF